MKTKSVRHGAREVWREIPSHTSYEASNLGRIRRMAGGRGAVTGRVLAQYQDRNGYCSVVLSENDKRYARKVHRLVAETFHGPCPEGLEVNHKDGVPWHNWEWNLEYTTHAENVQHSYEVLGRDPARWGEDHPNARLTNRQAERILKLAQRPDLTQKEIAERFGVSQSTVSRIVTRTAWKHIGAEQ